MAWFLTQGNSDEPAKTASKLDAGFGGCGFALLFAKHRCHAAISHDESGTYLSRQVN